MTKNKSISSARLLTEMALFIAMVVVIARFISINLPMMRIGFSFIPLMIAAIRLGTIPVMIIGGVADVLGAMLFPSGPFFIGYTISAVLTCAIYGIFFSGTLTMPKILAGLLLNEFGVSMLLTTLWTSILTGNPYLVALAARIPVTVTYFAVKAVFLYTLMKSPLLPRLKRF